MDFFFLSLCLFKGFAGKAADSLSHLLSVYYFHWLCAQVQLNSIERLCCVCTRVSMLLLKPLSWRWRPLYKLCVVCVCVFFFFLSFLLKRVPSPGCAHFVLICLYPHMVPQSIQQSGRGFFFSSSSSSSPLSCIFLFWCGRSSTQHACKLLAGIITSVIVAIVLTSGFHQGGWFVRLLLFDFNRENIRVALFFSSLGCLGEGDGQR